MLLSTNATLSSLQMKSRTNTIPPRTNGTNTSPSKPTPETSTSPTSTSPTSPAAAAAVVVLLPSTPPTTPLQTQTPTTPTLNRNPSPITATTIQRSSSSSNNSSHQISPTCPSAQCPSSPRLPSTRIPIQIDCPRGTTIPVEEQIQHLACPGISGPKGEKLVILDPTLK